MIPRPSSNFVFLTPAEVVDHLGVPLERIRMNPPPGQATEADAVLVNELKDGGLCELVDGTLVEKAMGFFEAKVGGRLYHWLESYLDNHPLGMALPADGMVRIDGQIRLPDVSFFFWSRFPNNELPHEAALSLTPDWAVEVLSPSNTKKEMKRKRRELFEGGGQLFWEIEPEDKTIRAYTDIDESILYVADKVITAAPVLPEFSFRIQDLFDRAVGQPG